MINLLQLFSSIWTVEEPLKNTCQVINHVCRENQIVWTLCLPKENRVFPTNFSEDSMAESIYYDSLKVSKSKCQLIWREWRGGNGGALLEASRGLRGLQMHIGDSEVWWQPLLSLWGSLEASKKVRRFRRAISATWFDTLILTLSKSHSRLTTLLTSEFWSPIFFRADTSKLLLPPLFQLTMVEKETAALTVSQVVATHIQLRSMYLYIHAVLLLFNTMTTYQHCSYPLMAKEKAAIKIWIMAVFKRHSLVYYVVFHSRKIVHGMIC